MAKKKYTKLGTVMEGQYGPYLMLGNPRAKDEKYRFHVEVRVTSPDGSVVAYGKDKLLSLFDPRKRPGITEEQSEKIPSKVLYELVLVEEE